MNNAVHDHPTGPAAAAEARRHAVFHPLRVAAVEPVTDDSVAVTFEVPVELAGEYCFLAGQHLTVRRPEGGDSGTDDIRRNYSICAPASSRLLRMAVKRLEDGAFSAYAAEELRPGDVLDVMTPTGRFVARPDPLRSRHVVALAAGSGIAPVISILATVLEEEPGSRCTLVYGNRTARSIMFLEELEDLKDRYPGRFTLLHVLSRERGEIELLAGRIDADKMRDLLGTLLPPETIDDWFLCGPSGMIDDARRVLADAGVDPRRVHMELFHVAGEGPRQRAPRPARGARREGSEVTVLIDGRASTFHLPADAEPVLDAALAVRDDAPYSCTDGVCGTCRARLRDGEVEMDRCYALEPDEVEAGYVLTCQSHPRTDKVVLDYDA
ncbi:MAG: 1,2-phenylacetyl-CoA epoxidase subunit PaaE [Streptosporangiaceae bacterium]